MDNDPPPSYSSVVSSGRAGILGPEDAGNTTGSPMVASETGAEHQEESALRNRISSKKNSEPTTKDHQNAEETSQNHQASDNSLPDQRDGLWDRFKRGLEGLALFVIQILD